MPKTATAILTFNVFFSNYPNTTAKNLGYFYKKIWGHDLSKVAQSCHTAFADVMKEISFRINLELKKNIK